MALKTAFNIEKLVRENIKKLRPYSSARDEFTDFDKKMVFLDANENPFDNGVNRYPDPQQRKLKKVLAELKGIAENQILLGNGSDEVLDLIFRAFCEPKIDNVITLPPTYGMYKVLADVNDVENREVLLTEDFQPDVARISATADKNSKLLLLCSPNNPTGNAFEPDRIEQLLKKFNGLVIIDEAYIDFSDQQTWLKKLDIFSNLIVTQTLSKAYGMAGIRLGIAFASREIISVLSKIKPPYNINELTQQRALKAVLNRELVENDIDTILREKNKLFKALLQIKIIEKAYASDANFILSRIDDANKRYAQLLERGIVIRNRSTQPLCSDTLRFTVGTKTENEKLIAALKEIDK